MSDWGQGAKNNTIGWGQGACDNTIGWGTSQKDNNSWSGDTDISGSSGAAALAQIDNLNSIAFDGVNDYIDAGTGVGNALGSSATNFSVSGWFKTVVNPLPSGEGMFSIGLGPVNAATTSPFEFFQDYYQVLYVRSGVSRVGFSFDVRPEAWRHYCVVYDGTKAVATDRFNLYINGVAPTKINLFGTIPTSINLTNQSAFIGGVSANKYYNGNIDEVAVFNYSLTESEALSIYNATTTGKTADLSQLTTPPIAWYRM